MSLPSPKTQRTQWKRWAERVQGHEEGAEWSRMLSSCQVKFKTRSAQDWAHQHLIIAGQGRGHSWGPSTSRGSIDTWWLLKVKRHFLQLCSDWKLEHAPVTQRRLTGTTPKRDRKGTSWEEELNRHKRKTRKDNGARCLIKGHHIHA